MARRRGGYRRRGKTTDIEKFLKKNLGITIPLAILMAVVLGVAIWAIVEAVRDDDSSSSPTSAPQSAPSSAPTSINNFANLRKMNAKNVPKSVMKTNTGAKPVTLEGNKQLLRNLRNYLETKK